MGKIKNILFFDSVNKQSSKNVCEKNEKIKIINENKYSMIELKPLSSSTTSTTTTTTSSSSSTTTITSLSSSSNETLSSETVNITPPRSRRKRKLDDEYENGHLDSKYDNKRSSRRQNNKRARKTITDFFVKKDKAKTNQTKQDSSTKDDLNNNNENAQSLESTSSNNENPLSLPISSINNYSSEEQISWITTSIGSNSIGYNHILYEERFKALQDILNENDRLEKEITELKEENSVLRPMFDEIVKLKEMLNQSSSNEND